MVEEEQKRKRGGGPKTPEGKAVVRRNPIKHGVLALRLRLPARSGQAPTPVITLVEREEDWDRGDTGLPHVTRSRAITGMVLVVRCWYSAN